MVYKIYTSGNMFYIEYTSNNIKYGGHSKDILILPTFSGSTKFSITGINNWVVSKEIDFSEIDLTGAPYTDITTFIAWYEEELGKCSPQGSGTEYVTQANYVRKLSNIDENKEYYFLEPVTFYQSITLDKTITIRSYGTAVPRIISGGAFPIFSGNSAGNVFMYNIAIDNSFLGSTVFDLVGATGFETFSLNDVNLVNSEGLGELNGYRQIFYSPVDYLGGNPSLTIPGAFGGLEGSNFNE